MPCANIIRIGYSNPNNSVIQAAIQTELVGRQMALLIHMIVNVTGANVDEYHLIELSLGAQVNGFCGRFLQSEFGLVIGRITGTTE